MGTEGKRLRLFGEYELDTERDRLLRAGHPVRLGRQACRVLKCLAGKPGVDVSKDDLIREAWEGRAVTDDSLSQQVRAVRKALGEGGERFIVTERDFGYRFEPPPEVEIVRMSLEEEWDESEDAGRALTPAEAPGASALPAMPTARRPVTFFNRHRRAALVTLAALSLFAAGAVYFGLFSARGRGIRSVAVLPFANASGDPGLEYLSDGLSESLIDRLSQLPGVKVIARSSSFKYKGREVDPREAGRALGVEALLTGRVAQRGDELHVRAELVDARTGAQLWGEQYSRRAVDLQWVQEEIARTVSRKLHLRLTEGQERRLERHATGNTQAYQFYLNGLFYLRKTDVESNRRALDYFNQAIATDPDFALAWAGAAKSYIAFAGNSWLDPKEANAKAKAAAQNALRLDETLPEAHTALALIKQNEWDWAGAEREYGRAIELNPSLMDAHQHYSTYLSIMGRHAEALAEVGRAQELDPLLVRLKRLEAMLLMNARRYDEALELMQQGIRAEPPGSVAPRGLAFMYEAKGMYDEAIEQHRKVNSIQGETTGGLCYLGWALAAAGRRKEAQDILDRLKAGREYVSPAELAGLYATLGDKEAAFAELEKAFAAHDLQLQYLNIDPHYDSLRPDPRFAQLVRRVGLTP